MENQNKKIINISTKPFIIAAAMLFGLMILTYVLTFILPAGVYDRQIENGSEMIISGTYHQVDGGIPFWKWILSPILVLTTSDGVSILAICFFLLVIGGSINPLDSSGVMGYMLNKISHRFSDRKYVLLAVTSLFFMTLGSVVGSFEDAIPLVPIVVALAYSMGWDGLVGLGMSLLSLGCGFATGICNLYTVGVAQRLADLPLFSGISFRILSFVLVYAILVFFVRKYAKKIEKNPESSLIYDKEKRDYWTDLTEEFVPNKSLDRAILAFGIIIGFGLLLIMLSSVVTPLQDIITPVMAAIFLAAGTASSLIAGLKFKEFIKLFLKGVVSILPAIGMILIASSVKYTLSESNILDTILNYVVGLTEGVSPTMVVLMIYLLVLIMNLFIGSASAKAFLLMPLIVPLADMNGVTRQLSVLAFIYGDGFSNIFYPTNPVLLISLGIVGVGYTKWVKWSYKFQIAILALTCGLLMLASYLGYGA